MPKTKRSFRDLPKRQLDDLLWRLTDAHDAKENPAIRTTFAERRWLKRLRTALAKQSTDGA